MLAGFTLALPKGRVADHAMGLLEGAGFCIEASWAAAGRRLQLDLPAGGRALLVKPVDVPTYVERGVADFGIVGSDTLREQARDLYEPVDLRTGACRLVIAEPVHRPSGVRQGTTMRVATKYPRITRDYYHERGIETDIITLYGSVELGALTGLADQVVDLVESGETLRQNGLREVETIMDVSSRFVVHPATLKLHAERVSAIIEALRRAVAAEPASEDAR